MNFRLLTREEIRQEFPREKDVLSAVAEVVDLPDSEGDIYLDTCFLLHGDGTLSIPHIELPFDDLLLIIEMLERAGKVTRELRSVDPSAVVACHAGPGVRPVRA